MPTKPVVFGEAAAKRIAAAVKRVEATPYFASGGKGGGPRSPSQVVTIFFADHLAIAAASGLLSGSITLSSTTGDVYKVSGGGVALAESGATIFNAMPDATHSTKRQGLIKNPDGSYSVFTESCTSP